MQLFQLINYSVTFDPITMTIKAFSDIRDKNNGDEAMTLKELSFVWFFCDMRSDYIAIIDEDDREEAIREGVALPKDWRKSDEVIRAIDYYKENSRTPSSGLYDASIAAASFVENQLKNPQALLDKVDAKGTYVYKLDNITKMLKDLPDIMKKLHEARTQVVKEAEANGGLKGGKEKAVFEDGI